MSGFIVAVPFSMALGAPLSAVMLEVHWFGLAGWQWLFILEGLPAVILGVITLFVFTDRPRDARWLTASERGYLEGVLAQEASAKDQIQKVTVSQALRLRNVWLLALGIFATNTGGYALGFWLPTTVKSLSGGSDQRIVALQRPFLSVWRRGRTLRGLLFRPQWRSQMALRCRSGGHRALSWRQRHPRPALLADHDLAFAHRSCRILLAPALLGTADSDVDRFRRRGQHWLHQYLREHRGISRQPLLRVDERSRGYRQHLPVFPGGLLSHRRSDRQLRKG